MEIFLLNILLQIIPQLIQSEIAATLKSENRALHLPSENILEALQKFNWENAVDELSKSAPLLLSVISGKSQ